MTDLFDGSITFVIGDRRRAHVTNTQLGQEEQSAGIRLLVSGSGSGADDSDAPARIVIGPRDTQVVRGAPVTELHCIANAR